MEDAEFHLRCLVHELGRNCRIENILCEFGRKNSTQIVSTLNDLLENVTLLPVQKEVANLMFEICEEIENEDQYIAGKRIWLEELLTDDRCDV